MLLVKPCRRRGVDSPGTTGDDDDDDDDDEILPCRVPLSLRSGPADRGRSDGRWPPPQLVGLRGDDDSSDMSSDSFRGADMERLGALSGGLILSNDFAARRFLAAEVAIQALIPGQ